MKRILKGILATCAAGLIGMPASAQQVSADGEFSLQGRLTTGTSNEAVVDGQHELTVTIYEAGTNTVIATETDNVVTVDGVFTTMIGDNSTLEIDAESDYEIGVAVNGGTELSPRIMIGDAPSAIVADVAATANLALDAETVGGFGVSLDGTIGPNQVVTTNAQGELDASLLDGIVSGNVVTSINGETGAVNLNVNGSGVSLDNDGNGNLTLNFTGTGSGSGDFTLPFTGTSASGSGSTAFSLTSTGAGSAATFINTSTGSALEVSSNGSGSAALEIENTAGTAIEASGDAAAGAVVELQNTSSSATAELIAGLNASGETVFSLGADGSAMINATSNEALQIVGTGGESRFTIMADGSTTIDATGSAALSLVSDTEAALNLQSTAEGTTGTLIEGLDATNNTVFEVAADGQTSINSSAANALDVTTSASGGAALRLQNTAEGSTSGLITALDNSGSAVFEVMGSGRTTIDATVDDALEVSTSVAGGTALRVDGGLELPQAAGTGTLTAGTTSATVNNALVNSNSIVMLTVNSATNLASGLRVSAVGDGSFTVSLIDTTVGAVAGNVTFNYLIINQ